LFLAASGLSQKAQASSLNSLARRSRRRFLTDVFVGFLVTHFGKLGPAVQPTALFVEKSVHLGAYLL
jgi:hypothetical protein